MRDKSDIFFGIAVFLALFGNFGIVLYIASRNPENPMESTAIIPMVLFFLSWIGIYLAHKFTETQEDKELIDAIELAYDNQKKIVTLKEKLK